MNADLLDRLIAAGTPTALVAEVALEIARAEVAGEGKGEPTAGALRMRRYRERHAASHSVTGDADVTKVTAGDDRDAAAPSPNKAPHTPKINPTPPTGEARPRKAPTDWACPEGVDPQHWTDFLANRRAKRLACTETAYQGQLKRLAELADAHWPPGRIVQHAAEQGWAGIHDPRTPKDHRNGNRPRPSFHDRPSGWAARPGMAGLEPASLDD